MKEIILLATFLFVFNLQAGPSPIQIEKWRAGIFEIIIPKIEDSKITYKEELPWNLVPYHERNDRYHSIGTAFALGENYFVSAAHVFQVPFPTVYEDNFFLRNEQGQIFKIKKVLKYSNYHDTIAFSLEKTPSKIHIFKKSTATAAGESVYTGGNALGQGVVFRAGTITSYTDEHIAGKWKHIRYSAPASPGNSGGPLLNAKGEVVGIVTMKTANENLNYALPIIELEKLSLNNSTFLLNNLFEYESQQTMRYKWEFKTKLPITLAKLMKQSQDSLLKKEFEVRKQFVKKYKKNLFPQDQKLKFYRQNQSTKMFLGIIDNDGNGMWGHYRDSNQKTYHINPNQKIYVAESKRFVGKYQILVEKPKDISLEKFFKNPKIAFDIFVKTLRWYREIGGAKIPVTSYGDPDKTTLYTDIYGRPWITGMWELKHSNYNFFIYCLTSPKALACDVFLDKKARVSYLEQAYKMNLHRIILSYQGTVEQWKEFLQLPQKYIPTFLQDIDFKTGKNFSYKVNQYQGTIKNFKPNKNTELGTWIKLSPENYNQLEILSFYIKPNQFEDDYFLTINYERPIKGGADWIKSRWSKQINQQAPYHNKVYSSGKNKIRYKVLSSKGEKRKKIKIAKCFFNQFISNEDFKKKCNNFIDGIDK